MAGVLRVALLAWGGAMAAPAVVAQTEPRASPRGADDAAGPKNKARNLADVTVTAPAPATTAAQRTGTLATGLPGSVLETPFSVTTVPADTLREQSATTLQDALRNVPGVQADSGFNGSHTQFFSIRGAVADSGTGSNRVLRDGVRLSNYPYVPAFVQSVDVLRGPGAAIGVRSEPGGSVNIVTKQPELRNFGSVLLGKGGQDAGEATVDLNRVLSEQDELAARIIVTRSDASRWRHVPDRLDGLKLGIAKSDGNLYHLRAGLEATNQTYRPDYGLPAAFGRPVAVPLDRQLGEPFADSTIRNRIVDLHGDVALSPSTRAALDFTHLEGHSTAIRNLVFGQALPRQPAGTYTRVTSWEPGTDRRIDSLVASVTSAQAFAGLDHQLYLDAGYYRENLNQPSLMVPRTDSPPINVYQPVYGRVTAPLPGTVRVGAPTQERLHAASLSAQDQIDLGDWSVVLGTRFVRQSFLYGTPGVQSVDESRWSPKVAVLRRFGDADTVYANVATGVAPNQVSSSGNQSLPSRRSAQAELGWKSLWQGGRLQTDVAVYRLQQRNLISSDQTTPANIFDFTVDGSARSQGVEASVTGQVTDRVDVSAAYSYTDAHYQRNALHSGNRIPNVARHAVNLWGQYAWDNQWKSGAGLYLQSARYADEDNTTVLPGYGRLDLTQSWRTALGNGQSFELLVALRNAFDKDYFVSSHLHVNQWIMPGQGRNLYVSGIYRF